MKNIRRDDLAHVSKLKELFSQAVKAGWVNQSDAAMLNWFAAAVRARSVRCSDPVRVFVALVKQKAWHFITHEQEERARCALKNVYEQAGNFKPSRELKLRSDDGSTVSDATSVCSILSRLSPKLRLNGDL